MTGMDMQDEATGRPVRTAAKRRLALSPSRATDFKNCPLLYRFRAIDRIPEPPSPQALRGTLVHAVLQELFETEPARRHPDLAARAVRPRWQQLLEDQPELADVVAAEDVEDFLDSAESLIRTYFSLEDPRRFTPEHTEYLVEATVGSDVPLRGYIDRLDTASNGQVRVVDYKTGKSPPPYVANAALYQLKFYALILLRSLGVLPAQLKLLYLGDGKELSYAPTAAEIDAFEGPVIALWRAIQSAQQTGDFRPRRNRLCDWCAHQRLCPSFGGTPPPYPDVVAPTMKDLPGTDGAGAAGTS